MAISMGTPPITVTVDAAWRAVDPLLTEAAIRAPAQQALVNWCGDATPRSFANADELAKAVKAEVTGKRENYFYLQAGENLNVETVIFRTVVPTDSIGWSEPKFFQELGHPANRRWLTESVTSRVLAQSMNTALAREDATFMGMLKGGLRRRAEQEYLLANMVKGALWEAAEVANEFKVGIAVRGTGLAAHMGIESGDPTKAQEFKNKTSKNVDVVLCEELEAAQVGTVVHYDPRVEWNSRDAQVQSDNGKSPLFAAVATKSDWEKKKLTIPNRLGRLGPNFKRPSDKELEDAFFSRSKEYLEEDHEYRKGHYAPYTTLVGPYIRLKARPAANMVGDHDLFAFTDPEEYGQFMPDTNPRVAQAQRALQNKPTFQAQHGGIWYWQPGTGFNIGIKAKIMGAHGPEGSEPLVYIMPHKLVTAAYYVADADHLASVWSNATWTKWLEKTHSGALL